MQDQEVDLMILGLLKLWIFYDSTNEINYIPVLMSKKVCTYECWSTSNNDKEKAEKAFLPQSSLAITIATPLEWMDSRMGYGEQSASHCKKRPCSAPPEEPECI